MLVLYIFIWVVEAVLQGFLWGSLGGSWVVIRGVILSFLGVVSLVVLLIALLISTIEPPSRGRKGLGPQYP